MRKLILALPLFLLLTVASRADEPSIVVDDSFHISDAVLDTLNRIPEIKNGGYYSFVDHGLNSSHQIALLERNGFSLNAGAAGDQNKSDWKAIVSIGYDFGKLKDYGFNVPIVKYIGFEPYIVGGLGHINIKGLNDVKKDFGVGANFVSLKF